MTRRRCLPSRLAAVALSVGVAMTLAPGAHAQAASNACFDAAVAGQKLRNAGKLLAANEQFLACVRPSCPDEVARDCSRWLEELANVTPTLVFAARDASGHDLTDVQTFVDEGAPRSVSDGRPIPLDPGPHRVRFVRAGQAEVVQDIVVRAGEKNRVVLAQFAPPTATRPGAASPDGTVPVGTWVAGAAGVAALGVFAYFGIRGVSDFQSYDCGGGGCSAPEKSNVTTEFRVADVALGVGIVALGIATVLYLTRPSSHRDVAILPRLEF
jgi:hypothetical protein